MRRKVLVGLCGLAFLCSAYRLFFAREASRDAIERILHRENTEERGEPTQAAASEDTPSEMHISNAECVFFGRQHERMSAIGLRENLHARFKERIQSGRGLLSSLTVAVASKPPDDPPSAEIKFPFEPPHGNDSTSYTSLVDRHIFSALVAAGVPPAKPTNDYEIIRRVTLDLTGRIPIQRAFAELRRG
jgi:hypothetical protein